LDQLSPGARPVDDDVSAFIVNLVDDAPAALDLYEDRV
jgi:hypothetical protein